MAALRAWQMVVARPPDTKPGSTFDAGKNIDGIPNAKRLEVIGPYDVVVEISGDSLEEIYKTTRRIASLETVAESTTYLAVRPGQRDEHAEKVLTCCLLLRVAPTELDRVQKHILTFEEVLAADMVLGAYDMVVSASVDFPKLDGFLTRLSWVDGILRTVTMFQIKEGPEVKPADPQTQPRP